MFQPLEGPQRKIEKVGWLINAASLMNRFLEQSNQRIYPTPLDFQRCVSTAYNLG